MSNKQDAQPFRGRHWPFLGKILALEDKRWPSLGL
jgi:hypothetical protein